MPSTVDNVLIVDPSQVMWLEVGHVKHAWSAKSTRAALISEDRVDELRAIRVSHGIGPDSSDPLAVHESILVGLDPLCCLILELIHISVSV